MNTHLSIQQLTDGLPDIQASPKDEGRLEMIVRRPGAEEREVIEQGRLNLTNGLGGDNWLSRGSASTPDGSADPEAQITIMNARVIQLLTRYQEHWQWAGDQFFVDLDLSVENLPSGTQLAIGSTVVEVSAKPHNGCKKISERFGVDALKFISAPENKHMRMHGINARVVQEGEFKTGDKVRKL